MLNKDTFAKYATGLVDILDLVQDEMSAKIARQLTKGRGLSDDDWKLEMLTSVGRLESGLSKVIEDSASGQAKEVQAIKQKAVNEGLRDTDAELKGTKDVQSADDFRALNSKLLETVSEKLTEDIVKSNMTMLTTAGADYMKNINDVLAVKEMGGITRQEATRQVLAKWSENGIPALIDRSQRRWQPDAYVNMVVRTNSMEIARKTQERRAVDYGKDLILTSQHADQSPEHAPFANRIFSLSGNDPKYPPFSQALSAGFMNRPNCRHTYTFYTKGLTDRNKNLHKEDTNEAYKTSQEQRKLERTIRAQKRQISTLKAGGYDVTAENAKLRGMQADMRTFINDTGRTRQRDREQI